jgi:hypothetical protein
MAKGKWRQKKQNWKRKELKPHEDVIIQHGEARESDIVIP